MRWLKIVGGIVAALLVLGVGAVLSFQNAVEQFERPPLQACAESRYPACDDVFEGSTTPLAYRLLHPAEGQAPQALFVILHGAGLSGGARDWMADGGLQELALREKLLIVLPSAGGEHRVWRDGEHPDHPLIHTVPDHVPALAELIDELASRYDIERHRVVLGGHSNGGTMAMRLACEMETPVAAVGSFGSPTSRYQIERGCDHPTPILLVHGDSDTTNRFEGGYGTLYGIEFKEEGVEPSLSSPRTAEFWRDVNGCSATATTEFVPDDDPDDGTVTRTESYTNCASDAPVVHAIIENGGHFVPGDRQYPIALRAILGGKRPNDYRGYEFLWQFASPFVANDVAQIDE